MYKITDADKANFDSISWELTPSSARQTLVYVSPTAVTDTSKAPARYKGRITWTGDLSKSVASFVLTNVTPGDEEEYGVRIKFGLFDELQNSVDLKVLGKYTIKCFQSNAKGTMDNLDFVYQKKVECKWVSHDPQKQTSRICCGTSGSIVATVGYINPLKFNIL